MKKDEFKNKFNLVFKNISDNYIGYLPEKGQSIAFGKFPEHTEVNIDVGNWISIEGSPKEGLKLNFKKTLDKNKQIKITFSNIKSKPAPPITVTLKGFKGYADKEIKLSFKQEVKPKPNNWVDVPVGTVVAYAGDIKNVQDGWLLCNGASVIQADYPQLYAALGSAWGKSGRNFNLPDLRGRFLRGVDAGAKKDPDRAKRTTSNAGGNTGDNVGSHQGYATAIPHTSFTTNKTGSHTHSYTDEYWQTWDQNLSGGTTSVKKGKTATLNNNTSSSGNHSHTITGGDTETRPVNAAVHYIIKY